jgi:hypothetical protein
MLQIIRYNIYNKTFFNINTFERLAPFYPQCNEKKSPQHTSRITCDVNDTYVDICVCFIENKLLLQHKTSIIV